MSISSEFQRIYWGLRHTGRITRPEDEERLHIKMEKVMAKRRDETYRALRLIKGDKR